jgi:hypothetical protein
MTTYTHMCEICRNPVSTRQITCSRACTDILCARQIAFEKSHLYAARDTRSWGETYEDFIASGEYLGETEAEFHDGFLG